VSTKKQNCARIVAAWLCLMAVALLYAPMAGAAWLAHSKDSMDCCAGGFCPMAAHRHHKQMPAPSQNSSPMNCEHDMGGMNGMGACSVSCCQNPARLALLPSLFLLPPASLPQNFEPVTRPVQVASSLELWPFLQKLSPPPKLASSLS
jgi:hypothetical protein